MRAAALLLLALVVCAGEAAAQAESSAQQRFAAATALEARGDYGGAAAALEQLGHEQPDDPFAPDALYEAAVVADERLGDPTRARRLYEELATRYPTNRLVRRARSRADFLGRSLASGEEPLREYDAILASAGRDKAQARERMAALLAAHPDFALSDRALYWLGQAWLDAHDDRRADERFAECERRFGGSEWAARCKKARADLLLGRGHPFAARALYRELAASDDALARSAGAEGLVDSAGWLMRTVGVLLAALYLLGFMALQLRAIGTLARLKAIPDELIYYLPVSLLFVAAALTENRLIGIATAIIAAGGALVVWLTALAYRVRLERGVMGRGERLRRIVAVAAAVLLLTFLAVQVTGLTDLVAETLRSGPER